jgi:RNA polymerase sigma-70 factor (ECF subfamily)
MFDAPTFEELIQRVRAGDQDAATTLVKSYESAIRRAVRFRLADSELGTLLDSMDICQSVMASFFIRAASGQYELKTPGQLVKLLTAMARNKLNSQARKQFAQRRDSRRVASGIPHDGQFIDPKDSPSMVIAAQDLLREVHRRLSPEDRRILELRNQGHEWAAVAEELGGSAEGLRRKLSRALDRVTEQLGLDDTP